MRISSEMDAGRAGEHLVLADLLLAGWVAYPTSQGVPYDIAVDLGDQVVRIQVKSTLRPKSPDSMKRGSPLYVFNSRRAGKRGRRRYGAEDFDVIALVALDRRLIAYYAWRNMPRDCISIRVPGVAYGEGGTKPRHFEDAPFEFALNVALQAAAQL